jgi:serine-type D-Ala-D-Ala carboxypeptidase/endopeptidase (penicillin-binding protein 4)
MIMRFALLLLNLSIASVAFCQTVTEELSNSINKLEADSSLKHGIVSLYVIDNKTGKVIYDRNSQMGLPAGSTQKVITSVTAFELLGKDYRYKTELSYNGNIKDKVLSGQILVEGFGDPTLGSFRFLDTKENKILPEFTNAIYKAGIIEIQSGIFTNDDLWKGSIVPDGWIWQDIGNYYGAGARTFNWRENQYDLFLKSGKNVGDPVTILKTNPSIFGVIISEATSAQEGSGDNAYIYPPLEGNLGYLRGTIPVNQDSFKISGSLPFPSIAFKYSLLENLKNNGIKFSWDTGHIIPPTSQKKHIYTHLSPPLDSINYWFLQKSINLYGEALLKTMAFEKTKYGSTDSGIAVIKDFWSKRGIDKMALNIMDGSGLSPANRITANALVTVLQYAKKQSWFSSFYDALPYVDGFKMKSGTIGGVLAYTGYVGDYTFAIIVNNYDGKARDMREKMLFLLDNLK